MNKIKDKNTDAVETNTSGDTRTTSDKIMENIAAWDETEEGKAFRQANDIRKLSKGENAQQR